LVPQWELTGIFRFTNELQPLQLLLVDPAKTVFGLRMNGKRAGVVFLALVVVLVTHLLASVFD
jgi:hypothetical protein